MTNRLVDAHQQAVFRIKKMIMTMRTGQVPNTLTVRDLSYRVIEPGYMLVTAIDELVTDGRIRVEWPYVIRLETWEE